MEKTYNPQLIEQRWSHYWELQGFNKPSKSGEPYCIMLPPPNITGTLHMGHGFQHTLMDALVRHKRMQGYRTLWQGGTDHAGIATQIVVEQQLSKQGLSRYDLDREAFIKRVWQWREESGNIITQQMRRLGLSIDWSRERFSMDVGLSHATTEAFVRLHREGLIYKGKRLVNWDPVLRTAISDLEVETEEITGNLWYIRYPLADNTHFLIVATTRPETLLGDAALAINPRDERYRHLLGSYVKVPLVERLIPIIGDESVDPEFGTGCVKITPAHDFNDFEVGLRHTLTPINIFTENASLNENVPKQYQGLDRFVARKKIIEDLTQQGFLEKIESHALVIPRGEKSGAIIEPRLTDQWFIKMKPLAKPALEAAHLGKLSFVPSNWQHTYFQWLENIQDWCISRQLWWGHRIPVWYDRSGNVYVAHSEVDVRERYQLPSDIPLEQETDVLDTWFSASLWPFATLDWPQKTDFYKTFYPTQVLVTGFDIIFFWVARMVMMGLKLTGKVPFHEVYITGLIRDNQGKKMSKSKGNILDPIDIIDGIDLDTLIKKRTSALIHPKMAQAIEKSTRKEFPHGIPAFGTDALRFTYCAIANPGRDINFDINRLEGYRNFCNKLWNAARFVLMNTEKHALNPEKAHEYNLADLWILSRFQKLCQRVEKAFEKYRFDLLAQELYEFTWNEYCDWYLELSKRILMDENATAPQIRGTCFTLLEMLESLIRLLHPLMPFITEEIWQIVSKQLGKTGKSIMLEPYPKFNKESVDDSVEREIAWLQQLVTTLRTLRSEAGISPAKQITVIFNKGTDRDKKRTALFEKDIKVLAKVTAIRWEVPSEPTATDFVDHLEIHIPLAGMIDKRAELIRLEKEISKLQKEVSQSCRRLENPDYKNKAPREVVEKEERKLKTSQSTLQRLLKHRDDIESL